MYYFKISPVIKYYADYIFQITPDSLFYGKNTRGQIYDALLSAIVGGSHQPPMFTRRRLVERKKSNREKNESIAKQRRNAPYQCTINPRRAEELYDAGERVRVLPVLHLAHPFTATANSAADLQPVSSSSTDVSATCRPRKIVSHRIIHFRRKLHVSVPRCATSPCGAFASTAVRFRPRRRRDRKSRPRKCMRAKARSNQVRKQSPSSDDGGT